MYVKFTALIRKLENQLEVHIHTCTYVHICTHTHKDRYREWRLITSVRSCVAYLPTPQVCDILSLNLGCVDIHIYIDTSVYILCISIVVNLQKD